MRVARELGDNAFSLGLELDLSREQINGIQGRYSKPEMAVFYVLDVRTRDPCFGRDVMCRAESKISSTRVWYSYE